MYLREISDTSVFFRLNFFRFFSLDFLSSNPGLESLGVVRSLCRAASFKFVTKLRFNSWK